MKSNKAPKKVRSLISGGVLLLSVIIALSGCQGNGTNSNNLIRVPPEIVDEITTQSITLEEAHPEIVSKMLTVHTAESFQKFMDSFTALTDSLTNEIDKKSKGEGDITLAEKKLSWQVGLYPMLVTDSAGKIRVKIFVRPTLAEYVSIDQVTNICNYRDSIVRKNTYKDVYAPVYDLGNHYP